MRAPVSGEKVVLGMCVPPRPRNVGGICLGALVKRPGRSRPSANRYVNSNECAYIEASLRPASGRAPAASGRARPLRRGARPRPRPRPLALAFAPAQFIVDRGLYVQGWHASQSLLQLLLERVNARREVRMRRIHAVGVLFAEARDVLLVPPRAAGALHPEGPPVVKVACVLRCWEGHSGGTRISPFLAAHSH